MKKIMKRVVSSVMIIAMTFAAMPATSTLTDDVKEVQAATTENMLELTPWTFYQTGTTTDDWNNYELCAFSGVTFGNDVTPFTKADFPYGQVGTASTGTKIKVTADGISDSFSATVISNGFWADYDNNGDVRDNPNNLQAYMTGIKAEAGHNYVLSFDASATKKKYAKITILDRDLDMLGQKIVEIETLQKKYSISFNCYSGLSENYDELAVMIELGAFVTKDETNWSGTVNVSNFKIVEASINDDISGDGLLTPWKFFQTGTTTNLWNVGELCAFSGVTFGDEVEALTEEDFPYGEPSFGDSTGTEITAIAQGASDSFSATIESNGWSASYGIIGANSSFNEPYTLRAFMDDLKLEYGHKYVISFEANISDDSKMNGNATESKLAKLSIIDNEYNTYASDKIKITKDEKSYTMSFTVDNEQIESGQFVMMLGAFPIVYSDDTSVPDLISPIENTGEINWSGTVNISNFTITDTGLSEDMIKPVAPATVLASNPSDGTILIAWTESNEAKELKQTYNIYLDDVLVYENVPCQMQYINNVSSGNHTVSVVGYLNGYESESKTYNISITRKPIDLESAVVLSQADNSITVLWTESAEQVSLGQTYNVYVNDELVLSNVSAGMHNISNVDKGNNVVKITAVKDGNESTGVTYNVTVAGQMICYAEMEINGFQISATLEGIRTIYSVSDTRNQVSKVGLIYGLSRYADAEDMVIGSSNTYVRTYDATELGVSSVSYTDMEDATSYKMTMLYGKANVNFFTEDTMVRVYVQLTDGSYAYSDVATYNIYEVADSLYKNVLMNNLLGHDYLYNNILTKVNPDYKEIDFNWGTSIIKPSR